MFKKFLKFKIISAAFFLSIFFVASGWLWAFLTLRKISQPLILHFNDSSINQIGSLKDLTAIAILGIITVIADFFLAFEFEKKDWFWGKLVAAAGLFVSILIFIGFAAIISVN